MATLNFDKLPQNNPFGIPDQGAHFATIEKAEVKLTKAKAEYLAVTLSLRHAETGATAKYVDNFYVESDSEFVRFKIGRFASVLALGLTGDVDLNRLAKILPGRQLGILIKHKEEVYNGNTTTKAEVDIFKNGYFDVSELQLMTAKATADAAPSIVDDEPAADGDVAEPAKPVEDNDIF